MRVAHRQRPYRYIALGLMMIALVAAPMVFPLLM